MTPKKSVGKGKHWRDEEILRLLKVVRDALPRGLNDWEGVAALYNTNRPSVMVERDKIVLLDSIE